MENKYLYLIINNLIINNLDINYLGIDNFSFHIIDFLLLKSNIFDFNNFFSFDISEYSNFTEITRYGIYN